MTNPTQPIPKLEALAGDRGTPIFNRNLSGTSTGAAAAAAK